MGPGMGSGMGPGGMNPGGMANNAGLVAKPLVYWKPESQKELMQSVLWWHNKNKAPSTLEILYTQEDLWIIEGLMNIIKATNGDAQESFQATIKEIEFLRIGKSAVGRAGTLTSLGSTGNMGMGMGMGMGAGGSDGMTSGGDGGDQMDMGGNIPAPSAPGSEGMGEIGEGGMVGGGAAAAPLDPASGRYVDTAFQPINGDTLRSVVSSGALNPTDAPLAVAKRVPVRMRFLMDQRKLNRLLSECGNADLLLEIRQVRINTEAFAAAGGGGMMGGMGGMMGGMGGMMGGMGGDDEGSAGLLSGAGGRGGPMGLGGLGGGEGAGTGAAGGGMVVGSAKSYDLPVEIYGIVYLFNPVDMNKLGIEKVTADTQIENVGRVSAEESTGMETDKPATVDPGASTPAGPATPAGEAGAPAAPATPENGAGTGVAPEGSVPAPGAAGAPAAGGAAAGGPAAGGTAADGTGAVAPPALPAAGTN